MIKRRWNLYLLLDNVSSIKTEHALFVFACRSVIYQVGRNVSRFFFVVFFFFFYIFNFFPFSFPVCLFIFFVFFPFLNWNHITRSNWISMDELNVRWIYSLKSNVKKRKRKVICYIRKIKSKIIFCTFLEIDIVPHQPDDIDLINVILSYFRARWIHWTLYIGILLGEIYISKKW